ncbi:MAG: hypothetical protein AAGC74_05505 [Verrucomicrobiota bacterium]
MDPAAIVSLILALVGSAGVFWVILKFSSEKITKQYRVLSERFGLELEQLPPQMGGFVRPEPTAYGIYREREISFSAPGKGLKGTRQIETVLKVELKDRTLRGQISVTGLLGLGQRDHGGQARWQSGDQAFDAAVDVRTNQGEIFARVLTKERQQQLATILKASKATLYIADGTMAYAKLGLIADDATRQAFEEVVDFLCDFAETVES